MAKPQFPKKYENSSHFLLNATSIAKIDPELICSYMQFSSTQNDGSTPPQFDPQLDTSPTISAYTINVGGSDTTKKLKVIR